MSYCLQSDKPGSPVSKAGTSNMSGNSSAGSSALKGLPKSSLPPVLGITYVICLAKLKTFCDVSINKGKLLAYYCVCH